MSTKTKESKKVLTPEEKAERKALRRSLAKLGFREGIVPFFIQMGILVLVILEFAFVIAADGNAHLSWVPDLVENGRVINDPNIVRFIYMFAAIPGAFLLVYWSLRIPDSKKAFWPALIAGILVWQSVGECSWHFGIWDSETFLFFPKIEGPQGSVLLLAAIPILLYVMTRKEVPFAFRIFLLSFLCNWASHWLILGIGPMWPETLRYHNPKKWPKIVGIVIGMHGTIMLVIRTLKAKSTEERLTLSVLLYTFFGMFVEGTFGLGGMLEE